MKVAIGSQIMEGPWGGGNLFTINLKNYLENNHIEVVNQLTDPNIDIILLTEPRIESATSTITILEALFYKKFVNKSVRIIHRINECDERKNTNFVNRKMFKISQNADFTIFVSSWIQKIYVEMGLNTEKSKVILSGSDTKVFNNTDKKQWDGKSRLKIVTHHWGNNWNKGFDVYSYIDSVLSEKEFNDKFSFTYIGNLPKNFEFKNTNYIQPLSGHKLSTELKKYDLYVTGSLNEPSGNHQIEASLCGLPVMFINSGGIPEYQNNYGIEYSLENITEKLETIYQNYSEYFIRNKNFNFDSVSMCKKYHDTFSSLYEKNQIEKKGIYLLTYRLLIKLKFIKFIKKLTAKIIYQLRK